jgi:sugar phosphate isomerase/epimerase
MSHADIRLGTLVQMGTATKVLPQILPHGFESFQLFNWERLAKVDLAETAKVMRGILGDRAVVSSIGLFGNPLQNTETARDWQTAIDACRLFGCDIVAGFTGALEDRSVPENMPAFKKLWSELAKRAEDQGVRIAFENCDMGGDWGHPKWNLAHAPTAWEMIFHEVPSPALGLEWEPCHQMGSGIDPLPQLRKWIGKIVHLHGKDATVAHDVLHEYGTRSGRAWIWHRHPGFGDTNWTDLISILRMNQWRGTIDIEGWHDPVYRDELEMTGQVHALNYLKQCRGGAYIPNPT